MIILPKDLNDVDKVAQVDSLKQIKLDNRHSWIGWNDIISLEKYMKEGYTNDVFHERMYNFLSNLNNIKTILEIGFNGGHSACCFLNACSGAKMYTFDICRWGLEIDAWKYLRKYFDLDLIIGDSNQTVPLFLKDNPELKFDLIFIDGCHEYAYALNDINNVKNRLNDGGILIIDDLHMGGVFKAIIDSKILDQYPHCVLPLNEDQNNQRNIVLFCNQKQ